eukprot:g8935.t1
MFSRSIVLSGSTYCPHKLQRTPVKNQRKESKKRDQFDWLRSVGFGGLLAGCLFVHPAASEAATRFPPISDEPDRCERGFVGNTIGQANAVSDKVLDLRKCVYAGKDLKAKVLAGAYLQEADFSEANLEEAVFSKAFASDANFDGANMENSILDRADFTNASFKNANLVNSVITGATFENANLENTNFEDALIGIEDVKRLCQNTTLVGESRLQVGCRK